MAARGKFTPMSSFFDRIPTFRRIGVLLRRALGGLVRLLFSRRLLTRLAFVTACLLTLALVFYTSERRRWRAAWTEYETTAKARGARMESKDFPHPPVPDAQNFGQISFFQDFYKKPEPPDGLNGPVFEALLQLIHIRENGTTISDLVRKIANDQLIPNRPLDSSGKSTADIANAILTSLDDECGAVSRQLHEAVDRPLSWFPSEWDKSDTRSPKKPSYLRMRKAAQLAIIQLVLHTAARDGASALEDLRLCLRVGKANENHPFLVAAMIRTAITALAMEGVWIGLNENVWDDTTLAQIDGLLAEIDLVSTYRFGLETERAFSNEMLQSFVEDKGALEKAFTDPAKPQRQPYWRLFPTGWIYRSKLKMNQHSDLALAALDVQRRTMSLDPGRLERMMKSSKQLQDLIFLIATPSFERAASRTAATEALLRQARAACALERYRLKHSRYPEKLDDLVAEMLLPEVPRDPTNNQPVEYQRTEDGVFTLRFPETVRLTRDVVPWSEAWKPASRSSN